MSFEFYTEQLAEVEELLSSTPDDKSLPKLKDDILELINLTRAKTQTDVAVTCPLKDYSSDGGSIFFSSIPTSSKKCSISVESTNVGVTTVADSASIVSTSYTPTCKHNQQKFLSKNRSKVLSTTNSKILNGKFEIPSHLLPLPSDTDVDRSRKRRTVKALKSKFRSRQKSVESEVKQKSWQDFMNKGNKRKGGYISSYGNKSIFATGDGINAKVGVVSNGVERERVTTIDRYIRRKRLRNDF